MKFIQKTNPFEKLIQQDKYLKDFTIAFQQAIECIIENKEDLAVNFQTEMAEVKSQMEQYLKSICFGPMHIGAGSSVFYLYVNYEIQIAEKLSSVLDWIVARKTPINSDPIETELFVLADSAAETIDTLTSLSREISKNTKKFKAKKPNSKAMKTIEDILEKSKKTFNLSLRMKRKILETEGEAPSLIHLVFLADMIGQVAEKTRETAWIATSLCC